ncbi:uncharacterized protein B0P05DRAFT_639631 [Gilbertella persicaria]|uniref:uncharacterized protein n=1 Tax=Gilbertella persicaria TaxID=101096 RepID=UPI00221EDB75|nr:uncharacterized protein B0P05DRAFT_639631 [Gilbertella persicaria]KAI8067655.1 hypothetical protein B0P05DRAFT_639631 [Gilbertella persicaria]
MGMMEEEDSEEEEIWLDNCFDSLDQERISQDTKAFYIQDDNEEEDSLLYYDTPIQQ